MIEATILSKGSATKPKAQVHQANRIKPLLTTTTSKSSTGVTILKRTRIYNKFGMLRFKMNSKRFKRIDSWAISLRRTLQRPIYPKNRSTTWSPGRNISITNQHVLSQRRSSIQRILQRNSNSPRERSQYTSLGRSRKRVMTTIIITGIAIITPGRISKSGWKRNLNRSHKRKSRLKKKLPKKILNKSNKLNKLATVL